MSDILTPEQRTEAAGEFTQAFAVATRSVTLFDRETYLQALLDSEEGVPTELEAAFRADVQTALRDAKDKRDAVAAYLLKLVTEAAKAEAEILISKQNLTRLTARKARYENAAERLRDYVLGVIREIGPDSKGKLPALEGSTATLKAAGVAPSVDIVDASKIPLEYCGIELKLSPSLYQDVRGMLTYSDIAADNEDAPNLPDEVNFGISAIREALQQGSLVPMKTFIGHKLKQRCPQCVEEACEACAVCGGTGFERVPGARLVSDKLRLVVS